MIKIIGILLVVFGVVDLAGSFLEFDLWGGFLGINLPEMIWPYSHYIEIFVGLVLINVAPDNAAAEEE